MLELLAVVLLPFMAWYPCFSGCMGSGTGENCVGKCNSGTTPAQVKAIVPTAQWSNNSCGSCGDVHGTHIMDQIPGSPCSWKKTQNPPGDCPIVHTFTLDNGFLDPEFSMDVAFDASTRTTVLYRKALSLPMDCTTLNESFPYHSTQSDDGPCTIDATDNVTIQAV